MLSEHILHRVTFAHDNIVFFVIIRSVCADLQSPMYWPGLINSFCELHFSLFAMREMINAFLPYIYHKFRMM